MKLFQLLRLLLSLFLTISLITILNNRPTEWPIIGKDLVKTPLSKLPPIGKFLDPFNGFWQNAESAEGAKMKLHISMEALKSTAKIRFDERMVPHIFAENEHDMFYLQGYVTAMHRLWQMEFQTHAAAGRASEIIGKTTIAYDKAQRRYGLAFAAENSVESIEKNPFAKEMMEAYTTGVNAYISNLSYKTMPLEYKLLDYEPEPWTILKCALMQKTMAHSLSGRDADAKKTNALALFGEETFELLYPDYLNAQDPIVPKGTSWNFSRAAIRSDSIPLNKDNASLGQVDIQGTMSHTTEGIIDPLSWHMPDDNPEFIEGSNNWAVAGKKTKSGYPIFCSDPHLVLGLPNIWYETQLHVPDYNVYGVSIPGMPGIFIGFNDSIAWGETNASRDVRDWYKMSFRDKTQNEYRYDEKWLSTLKRIETIEVRDGTTIMDTVVYTHLGPIVYTDPKHPNYNQSMRWVAHDPSDDWLTFYKLNKAKNYDDYVEALNHYDCPAQNFAFAAQDGDIAIWQQGRFPLLEENQGRFLQDGTKSSNEWQGYIPKAHNPHSYNPERGFISSTNQHPVDDTYPYYYTGRYEFYRNRRLNQQLAIKNNFVPEDMMRLQTDTYNLKAAETLPVILSYINVDTLEVDEKAVYALLKDWNYENNVGLVAPSAFEVLWDSLYHYVWDEITQQEELALAYPHSSATALFISTNPEHPLMDIVATDSTETLKDVVLLAFQKATDALEVWQNEQEGAPEWQNFRHAKLNHLLRIPAFSVKHLDMGGNSAILNALGVHKDRTAGPSWRMIVAMGKDKPQAWGIYPGGQSGNPGSYFYENFVDKFTEGTYDELLFLSDATEQSERILFTQNFSPR